MLNSLLFAAGLSVSLMSTAPELLRASDLQSIGRDVVEQDQVLVLLVSRDDCPYCITLKKEVLLPLVRSGEFVGQAVFFEFPIDDETPIRGFDGESWLPMDIARIYGATLTPTVLVLDGTGESLAEPRIGVANLEYYSWYLEQDIQAGLAQVAAKAE